MRSRSTPNSVSASRATIEGEWAGRVTGLGDQCVEIAMMRTPDGHSRLELSRFLSPPVIADHCNAPVNALGYLRVMFAVDDIDDTESNNAQRPLPIQDDTPSDSLAGFSGPGVGSARGLGQDHP